MAGNDDRGVEDAAILLMALGEESAAEVFKHLTPKEVQRLGEAITRTRTVAPSTNCPASGSTPARCMRC